MDRRLWNGLLWIALAGANGAAFGQALSFSACELKTPPLRPVAAECAVLSVPENREKPQDTIELHVARVPGRAKEKQADPIIFFAGGPGQAALEAYPMVARAFEEAGRDRDILLMDQRGTGLSSPLDCPIEDESLLLQTVDAFDWRSFVEGCLDRVDADTRYYATRHAVEDVEAFRVAMGVEQLNLIGGSYGTRMAMSYAQAYPERVRTMVLFGVVPQDEPLGVSHARNLEAALDRLFDRCAGEESCATNFGDIRAQLERLQTNLQAEPAEVALPHPATGEPTNLMLTSDMLAGIVRLLSYAPATSGMLPMLIHEAAERDRFVPLASQALMVVADVSDQISRGMELSVICSEDVPYFDRAVTDDSDTLMGNLLVSALLEQCKYWPTTPAPATFKEPLDTDIPTLLLSGETDPVTPPAFAERAATTLSNARHLISPGQGHNSLTPGCMPELVAKFLQSADPAGLEIQCLDVLGPSPFFTSFSGPEP